MKRNRLVAAILLLTFCLSLSTGAFAARDFSEGEKKAVALESLGLLQGLSANDFGLEKELTRAQALTMFIRIIGAEKAAKAEKIDHPFSDVPDWAAPYVSYAYKRGLTQGISCTEFNTDGRASAAMYLTFILRALSYSDENNRDFCWDKPFTLASSLGLTPAAANLDDFLRADMTLISWAALEAPMARSGIKLFETLIQKGLFTQGAYEEATKLSSGIPAKAETPEVLSSTEQQVADLVNAERTMLGLEPLVLDPELSQLAEIRAVEIISLFSHTRPDGRKCTTVMTDAGYEYKRAAENIAYGQTSPDAVMKAWINSSSHYKNIICPNYTKIGVGHVKLGNVNYWVQLFAG